MSKKSSHPRRNDMNFNVIMCHFRSYVTSGPIRNKPAWYSLWVELVDSAYVLGPKFFWNSGCCIVSFAILLFGLLSSICHLSRPIWGLVSEPTSIYYKTAHCLQWRLFYSTVLRARLNIHKIQYYYTCNAETTTHCS